MRSGKHLYLQLQHRHCSITAPKDIGSSTMKYVTGSHPQPKDMDTVILQQHRFSVLLACCPQSHPSPSTALTLHTISSIASWISPSFFLFIILPSLTASNAHSRTGLAAEISSVSPGLPVLSDSVSWWCINFSLHWTLLLSYTLFPVPPDLTSSTEPYCNMQH